MTMLLQTEWLFHPCSPSAPSYCLHSTLLKIKFGSVKFEFETSQSAEIFSNEVFSRNTIMIQSNGSAVPHPEDRESPYTMRTLIAMAILSAPESQLTSTQICEWISDSFPYYDISEYEWRQNVISTVSHDPSFTTLKRTDARGCFYHSIKPGAEFEVVKANDDHTKATTIGMARCGTRGGRAKIVQL